MRISRKGEYALRAMMYLAARHDKGLVRIAEIARAQKIPEKFLERILLDLRKGGVLRSVRGRSGGYALGRPPEQISLALVIRIIEGALAPLRCTSTWAHVRCPAEEGCGLHSVMLRVRNAIAGILEGSTLADLCAAMGRRGRRGRKRRVGARGAFVPPRGCAG